MSLVLLNLSLLWALRKEVLSLLKPRIIISKTHPSMAPRQRKTSKSSPEATLKKVQQQVEAGNKFVWRNNLHILLVMTIGLCVSLYYFVLSSEGQMRRINFPIASTLRRRALHHTGMAAATSAQHIIQAKKPFLVYGTAWKKERTAEYVNQAVHAGFRFIDTACQPRHYNETGVGEGWSSAAEELGIPREDFYLQTKYTPRDGQDPNTIPYDPETPYEEQVRTSLAVSLKNLKTDYLDALVIHSPLPRMEDTLTVWRVMESFVDDGKVKRIGISNANYMQFTTLYKQARIKPSVLQNRFHAETRFDTKLRHFCQEHGIWYQSFWTLTANRHALHHDHHIRSLSEHHELTPQTMMFAFLLSTGYITPLSGTTSKKHMAEDVAIMERIQGGERFFDSEEDMLRFSESLGMPAL